MSPGTKKAAKVIFACVQSAGRSQMAAGFFNSLTDPKHARAVAAGTNPAAKVHPEVVDTMNECGIDLSHAQPELLTAELAEGAAWLVTMGCEEQCPVVPGAERADWELQDPHGKGKKQVRAIRDEIRRRVTEMVQQHGWGRKAAG